MTDYEAADQMTVVEFCDYLNIPVYHVPNEDRRSPARGLKLKRMGMKAGVPDLVIPIGRGGFYGLYIEMKHGKNKTTPAQDNWLELLAKNHYRTCVCYGSEAAIKVIRDYMKQPSTSDFLLGTPAK